MPELPEVETTLNGIKPFVLNKKITDVIIRHYGLRWPIEKNIKKHLTGRIITSVTRRGKYLLLGTPAGTLIIHLGMSGSLRILTEHATPKKHDHIDLVFDKGCCLRLTDPRRFGAFIWTNNDALSHPLLSHLGPEPLTSNFSGKYLWKRAQKRKVPIKSFIMDSKVVVGVGNIYATEALFEAGIHPEKLAGTVSLLEYSLLVKNIKQTLKSAIKKGGTTLKDFLNSHGEKGYFSLQLKAYGRGEKPCLRCGTTLEEIRLGQRSTVFCPTCQT